MAWGRKKGGGRKEPRFGLAAAMADLRLDPKDRIQIAEDVTPKKTETKRKPVIDDVEDEAPPPREPKPRPAKSGKTVGRSRIGMSMGRMAYWALVGGLWGVIALIGVVVWAGAHLPPIQSLEIPTRPPTIELTGFAGSMLTQ